MYKSLDPGIRVVILKAICDIRVEVYFAFVVFIYHYLFHLKWMNLAMVG